LVLKVRAAARRGKGGKTKKSVYRKGVQTIGAISRGSKKGGRIRRNRMKDVAKKKGEHHLRITIPEKRGKLLPINQKGQLRTEERGERRGNNLQPTGRSSAIGENYGGRGEKINFLIRGGNSHCWAVHSERKT